MEDKNYIKAVREYSIDSIPLNKDEFIKLYDSVLGVFEEDLIYSLLYISSRQFQYMMKETKKLTVSSDISLAFLYFLANTGYSSPYFIPNETIQDAIINQPNPAITDVDKALISLINQNLTALLYPTDKPNQETKEEMYSYIFFLNNVQNYEYKTHMTLDLSTEDVLTYEFDKDFLLNFLTNPSFSETDSKMIPLSDIDVNNIKNVLEYRKKTDEIIVATRKNEQEYAKSEDNDSIWQLFISWLNYRSSEEKKALEIINSNDALDYKMKVYDRFLTEINDPNVKVLDSGLCLHEFKRAILERSSNACNYMEIVSNDKQKHVLDEFTIYSIFSPYSFSNVLISYHAFLIDSSNRYLELLLTSLEGFIKNNLGPENFNNDLMPNHNTIVERLIRVSNLIIEFYETHEETIKVLRFDSIQNEDTLSGQEYDYEIFRLLGYKEQKMIEENIAAITAIDPDDFSDFIEDYVFALLGEGSIDEVRGDFQKNLPNDFKDEDKLYEQTISNRLVVSVNAIYILVKTIEKLLDRHIIEESQREEVYRINRRLSTIEQTVVVNSYWVPMLSCLDREDREKIDEYRLRRGIDSSKIELKNEALKQVTLFNLVKSSIQDLHNEALSSDFDFYKVSEIKGKLRKKIEGISDSVTKDFVVDLVDQESQFLCKKLVSLNSGTDEFSKAKMFLKGNMGALFNHLPEKAADTLTTAELLYSKYANPEYAEVGFDYSCISALYYQVVESMCNELIWSEYANHLNNLSNFSSLYSEFKELPPEWQGYLPLTKRGAYFEKGKIANVLTFGAYTALFTDIATRGEHKLHGFRVHVDRTFGYINLKGTSEYEKYQKKIDDLQRQMYYAKPKRNHASHGEQPVSFKECENDKRIVLSDVDNIRRNYLGLIRQFFSLYRTEKRTS